MLQLLHLHLLLAGRVVIRQVPSPPVFATLVLKYMLLFGVNTEASNETRASVKTTEREIEKDNR